MIFADVVDDFLLTGLLAPPAVSPMRRCPYRVHVPAGSALGRIGFGTSSAFVTAGFI